MVSSTMFCGVFRPTPNHGAWLGRFVWSRIWASPFTLRSGSVGLGRCYTWCFRCRCQVIPASGGYACHTMRSHLKFLYSLYIIKKIKIHIIVKLKNVLLDHPDILCKIDLSPAQAQTTLRRSYNSHCPVHMHPRQKKNIYNYLCQKKWHCTSG
jgi:hypothetical protein